MADKDYEYRPGLIFKSQCSAHQEIIRGKKEIFVEGTKVDEVRELLAEFAFHGEEYPVPVDPRDPDGPQEMHPDIHGHFFHLDEQAEVKDWSDEERALVAKIMLKRAPNSPNYWLHSQAAQPRPWPKYDEAQPLDIPVLADQFGCLAEAIAYETENQRRPDVLKELREMVEQAAQVDELVAV